MKTNTNPLLMTDVYKLGHMRLYNPGTTKVYSYLCARSTRKEEKALFFGLQPYLKILETPITKEHGEEFLSYYTQILGSQPPADITNKINALVNLGYIPLKIKAVAEGTVIENKNVLATVTNTHPDFFWVVGFFESLLLKVWNTVSVATASYKYKKLVTKMCDETSDSAFLLPFLVHDFGYRGVSSEQTAELSGAAHLVNFCGTDTIPAVKFLKENYAGEGLIGASVVATEHSIHCSYGPTEEGELAYVNRMMELNPTGILSVVSDAYDYWRMLTVTLPKVKDTILAREGKYVVRPDSGDPMKILCGNTYRLQPGEKINDVVYNKAEYEIFECNDKFYKRVMPEGHYDSCIAQEINYTELSPEQKGTFRLLDELFGSTVNSKGYKELNPKIGVIYGDGMYYERFEGILNKLKDMGYASTNLVIGIGGLLLQQHNRDDLGFAFKATHAVINGVATELYKDPITDQGKRSHRGLMTLVKENGVYVTKDQVTEAEENTGELQLVFENGKITREFTLQEIRDRASI